MNSPAWSSRLASVALASALLAGCGREPAPASGPGAAPGAPTAAVAGSEPGERSWVGLLPCSDCQGIDTRLVLRRDGARRSYLMTETYLGGKGETTFNRAGSWTEQNADAGGETLTFYTLDPGQGGQRFVLQADGALELLDPGDREAGDDVAYRLQRQ
jgi:copper homeostasis protein (lipoprotein)